MKKLKFIFICILLLKTPFAFGALYEDVTPTKFNDSKNIWGDWQIVGYQHEWWISNSQKEKSIKQDMGKVINIIPASYDCKNPLSIEYRMCDFSGKNNCDNATTARLQAGKLKEINYLEIFCPLANSKRKTVFFGGMFYFNGGNYNVMSQTDGGYYILRKLTKQGIKSVGKIHKTSFKCNPENWTPVERLICTNKQLADMDLQLDKIYRKVQEKTDLEGVKKIKESQRKWVKEQSNTVDIIKLENLYKDRIEELNSI
jgi:uncharacterized protein YecT (DUF1311 family)